jgi:hypothetical protein
MDLCGMTPLGQQDRDRCEPWTPVTVPDAGTFVQAMACHGASLCLSGDAFGTLFAGTHP